MHVREFRFAIVTLILAAVMVASFFCGAVLGGHLQRTLTKSNDAAEHDGYHAGFHAGHRYGFNDADDGTWDYPYCLDQKTANAAHVC